MDRRLLVYVAGPYSSRWFWMKIANIWRAWRLAKDVWRQGHMAHCPHVETAFLDNIMAHDEWIARDLLIVERCDAILMCRGWRNSPGAVMEHDFAVEHDMPIFYRVERLPEVKRETGYDLRCRTSR